ncbi:DUF6207 family protein [Streptomyces sp. NPDC056353]|uniref:DUF6207 family protein n=1 Tax=Streptomyces TaxID=1883 RepID=UPI0028F73C70|nr:DUF6207 family protein [Streptomyces salinarius]
MTSTPQNSASPVPTAAAKGRRSPGQGHRSGEHCVGRRTGPPEGLRSEHEDDIGRTHREAGAAVADIEAAGGSTALARRAALAARWVNAGADRAARMPGPMEVLMPGCWDRPPGNARRPRYRQSVWSAAPWQWLG